MNQVFVDTVGFLALLDERDQWHNAAVSAFELARKQNLEMISSYFILVELGNAAARKPYRNLVFELRNSMEKDGTLIPITDDLWQLAWTRFSQRYANGAGFVDQTSFLIMKKMGIEKVITSDEHFRTAGFQTLM